MARTSRTTITPTTRPRGGGKLALFEVIRSAQPGAAGDDPPAAPAVIVRAEPPAPHALRGASQPSASQSRPAASRSGGPLSLALTAAAVAVLVVGTAAMVLRGRSAALPTAPASAPIPAVLDVSDPAARRDVSPLVNSGTLANPRLETESQIASAAPASGNVRRTNGLNYLVIQSYAKTEQDRAEATRDALLKEGVVATIETNVPGWGKNICVVGIKGFERIRNNPEYKSYCDQLAAVSQKYKSDRKVKAFDPRPLHWTRN